VTGWPFTPRTSIAEARAGDTARRWRDHEEARAAGLRPDEVGPFLAALAAYDSATPAWVERCALEEALRLAELRQAVIRRAEGWEDTREGMLVRVDAVIAELDSLRPKDPAAAIAERVGAW
jgi:predicted transcriptional regulator